MAIVDHIVELKDGGAPLSEDNVQSLCRSCHQRKTAREARLRRENHQQASAWHRAGIQIVS
ncbi:HNH endonuclease domain protein [Desulfosarcina variabilis str. Montpellier]